MAIETLMAGTIVHLSKIQFCGELVADGQTSIFAGWMRAQSSWCWGKEALVSVSPDMSCMGFIESASWMPKAKVQPPYRPCKPNPV
ncbi:hypothetical protein N7451_010190 [Penicillium sp. IBT 35674x]|nr:hypothetical protein N7451_010190 [Penicillium sp. IBT 35674x]